MQIKLCIKLSFENNENFIKNNDIKVQVNVLDY